MKSPFPGMDPYLEAYWRDVHHRFLTYACDDLQAHLPGTLRARLEERVFVEPDMTELGGRGVYPDLLVVERPNRSGGGIAVEAEVATDEPLGIYAEVEPTIEGFIEIIDIGSGNRVVTVVELFSISNKLPGEGQEKYLRKQREYQRGGVSLVEIDLLRGGQRVVAVPRSRVPESHQTTYSVCATRGWKRNYWELYRVPLRLALPTIRIPLRETDEDATLNLQTLIERCYANGRYDDIDYRKDLVPPLAPDDAAWAHELLVARGLREASR